MSQKRRNQRGIALIWAALVIFVMIGIVGLSLDWGKLALNVHQLHNAADAGALAGAQIVKFVPPAQTRQMAITVAHENNAEQLPVSVADNVPNDPNGEVVIGRWIRQTREFVPTLLGPNAVKVRGNRPGQSGDPPLALLFGPVFNVQTVNASRYAIAWSRASTGAGIICLAARPELYGTDKSIDPSLRWNNGPVGFLDNGGCDIDISWTDPLTGETIYGDVQVNSTSKATNPKAALAKTGTSGDLYVGEINVVGTTYPDGDSGDWANMYGDPDLPFSVNPDSPRIEDPLAALNNNPPNISTMPVGTDTTGKVYASETIKGGTLTLTPGYYAGGIDMSTGSITLNPGVYAFGGGDGKGGKPAGLVVGGGSVMGTEGVEIYITGDPDGSKTGTKTVYGRVDIGGSAHVELTSRGDVSPTDNVGVEGEDGVVLWQDKNDHNQASIIGTSDSWLRGTIYFPDNPAQVGGGTSQLGSQIICGALQINGNIDLGIAYDGRNRIISYRSVLVE